MNAAGGGHLAMLQWARENGAPWDERVCAYAARRGHLAMLQWARAIGAPWDSWTCANAARGGEHRATILAMRFDGGCRCDYH